MNWLGMNAASGRAISATDHIIQSVRDILITPVGSRVMRRDYGSELFYLIDQPQHQATRLRLMAATVMAIVNWERRISVQTATIAIGSDGRCTVDMYALRKTGPRAGKAYNLVVPL